MRNGVRFGRVLGIDLVLDYSWIFIFLLLTWSLTTFFARTHPGWGTGIPFLVAFIAAILFFFSVLLHELAHSAVALAYGVRVRSITLFLFGGISNIEREPPSARAEFLIALAGPLTSIMLGLFFSFFGTLMSGTLSELGGADAGDPLEALGKMEPVSTLLLWLGPINLVIGIFNMIPGFPLDGGRVLRALFWGITGDFRRATLWAAGAGQGIAALFMVAGVAMAFGVNIPVLGTGLVSGLWLVLIGWFLNNAAAQGRERVAIEDALQGISVSRMMRKHGFVVGPEMALNDLVTHFMSSTLSSDERAFPVMREGDMVGLVCLEDIRKIPREKWETAVAADVMTPIERLVVTEPNADASKALQLMAQRDVSQLPVLDHGNLVGMLYRRDFARWLELQWSGRRRPIDHSWAR